MGMIDTSRHYTEDEVNELGKDGYEFIGPFFKEDDPGGFYVVGLLPQDLEPEASVEHD